MLSYHKKKTMKKIGTPYTGYSQEKEERLEQMELKNMRKLYGNPNMSLQEMKEILRPKKEGTINVTFLKKRS